MWYAFGKMEGTGEVIAAAPPKRQTAGERKKAEERARFTALIRADPVAFAREVLQLGPYDKQREILEKATRSRHLSIVGANGVGKDWTLGSVLIPWWFVHHWGASTIRVVVLAPTHRQVHDIIWRELKTALSGSVIPIPGKMFETDRWEITNECFAVGLATDKPYNLQGYHAEHLLAICSEAHSLSDEHIEAITRLNPELLVLSGNPLVLQGRFYDSHHSKRHLWDTVEISALDTPNVQTGAQVLPGLVTKQAVDDAKVEFGEDSVYYKATVLSQWPGTLTDTIIPLDQVMAAVERVIPADERRSRPNVVAVDVARYGSDKTIVMHRVGQIASFAWKAQGENTMSVTGWVKSYVAEHPAVERLLVDDVGVGGGVVDRLREQGVPVVPFKGGALATGYSATQKYRDQNAEAWLAMADAFRAGTISIPNDRALIGQLASRKKHYLSDGRIAIQSKDEMRPADEMGRASWKSPDEADALAMTFAGSAPLDGPAMGGVKVYNFTRYV